MISCSQICTNKFGSKSVPFVSGGPLCSLCGVNHDDVIKWKHFPRYWPFVRGIHRSRWIPRTKASDAELWCLLWSAWINDWVNNREAGDLRRHRARYDVIVMYNSKLPSCDIFRQWMTMMLTQHCFRPIISITSTRALLSPVTSRRREYLSLAGLCRKYRCYQIFVNILFNLTSDSN